MNGTYARDWKPINYRGSIYHDPRQQVPGTTIPLHASGDDHGRDYCRQPGCDCPGFMSWQQRREARTGSGVGR